MSGAVPGGRSSTSATRSAPQMSPGARSTPGAPCGMSRGWAGRVNHAVPFIFFLEAEDAGPTGLAVPHGAVPVPAG